MVVQGGHLRRTSILLPMIDWFLIVTGVGGFSGRSDGFPGAMRGIEPYLRKQ